MKGYIYRIENQLNGKSYIGKTYQTIEKRWKSHLKDRIKYPDRPLYRALNKYGIENFSISQIEYCEDCEGREIYWINYYNTYKNGYNATLGGDGSLYFEYSDEEVINKFFEVQSLTETALFFNCDKNTIRVRLQNHNIDSTQFNYVSDKRSWPTRKVYTILEDKQIQFNSLTEAAQWIIDTNRSNGQLKHIICNISRVARKIPRRITAYGLVWNFIE